MPPGACAHPCGMHVHACHTHAPLRGGVPARVRMRVHATATQRQVAPAACVVQPVACWLVHAMRRSRAPDRHAMFSTHSTACLGLSGSSYRLTRTASRRRLARTAHGRRCVSSRGWARSPVRRRRDCTLRSTASAWAHAGAPPLCTATHGYARACGQSAARAAVNTPRTFGERIHHARALQVTPVRLLLRVHGCLLRLDACSGCRVSRGGKRLDHARSVKCFDKNDSKNCHNIA